MHFIGPPASQVHEYERQSRILQFLELLTPNVQVFESSITGLSIQKLN